MNTYTFQELCAGMTAHFIVKVTFADIDRFCEVSGDNSPIHMNLTRAKEKGFSNRVAHGMLISAYYSRLVGVYLPGANGYLHAIDISFKKPVYPEDEIIVSGEIVYIHEAYKQIEISAYIKKESGEVFSKAKIKVGVLDE